MSDSSMPWSLSVTDWVLLGVMGLVALGALVVGAIRLLWLYRTPVWLRRTLLWLFGGGVGATAAGFLLSSQWLAILGLAIAVVPLGGWLVTRSIFYDGPPPGLLEGPKALDTADDVLDSAAGLVGLEHRDHSDEDDA